MTAINACLLPDAVHVFSDAGHYRDDTLELVGLEEKVHTLSGWNAVVAACGPSWIGGELSRRMTAIPAGSAMRLRDAFLAIALDLVPSTPGRIVPYTAFLFGWTSGPWGIAVEEGRRVHELGVGNVTSSLAVPEQFDPLDVRGSGLRMMEAQRRRYQVVHGHFRHTRIGPNGIASEVIHEWPR